MLLTKTKRLLAFIAASSVLASMSVLLFTAQPASAAAALCFEAPAGKGWVNQVRGCGGVLAGGKAPAADKCYVYDPANKHGATEASCDGLKALDSIAKCYAGHGLTDQVLCSTLAGYPQTPGAPPIPDFKNSPNKCYYVGNLLTLGDKVGVVEQGCPRDALPEGVNTGAECYADATATQKVDCSTIQDQLNNLNFPQLEDLKCYDISPLSNSTPAYPTVIKCPWDSSSEPAPTNPSGFSPDLGAVDQEVQDSILFNRYLIPAINILSSGVVVMAAVMMVISGIQYSAGRDNPQAVAAAKAHIINIIIGLVAYVFIYGILQFIIPGGLL